MGIRASRLSSHHGEFCKLFCGSISRGVDFFSEDDPRSEELPHLLTLIQWCTAFSSRNEFGFSSLFDVTDHDALKSALDGLHTAVLDIHQNRNRLCHNCLALDSMHYDSLIACSRQLLVSLCRISLCVEGGDQFSHSANDALAVIQSFGKRDAEVATSGDSNFDSFGVCLRKDIQHQLIASTHARVVCFVLFTKHSTHIRIRKSNRRI